MRTMDTGEPRAGAKGRGRSQGIAALSALLSSLIVGFGLVYFYFIYPVARAGPAQPVPFSHRLHVDVKEIDCRFCHSTVERAPNAGLPAAEKCLFCHNHIITEHEVIQNLRGYVERGEPIPWVKVTYLPDHVYFSHQQHVRSGIDCARCHGDVEQMDRVYEENRLLMGFCVECHRGQTESELPLLDCVTCHQ
ncbi:cytochrome c3 family protein [Candidatus Sumerlaeota bacterium]|nr:cytochrome c3 family protein [Candidatus Sumerlaeota bacterium]